MAEKKSPGRPRSAASHEAMLKAALELLSEVGFEAMSIDAIAARAKVGKTTIYRRYRSKDELVADAIESIREEVLIPNTGSLWGDIDAIIDNAAQITFTPLGRQAVAMILSSASANESFAAIYKNRYLEPRRVAFATVIKRAQQRGELAEDIDAALIFDTMSGIMLFALLFPSTEPWSDYVRRALTQLLS